jgi:HD-like signal output (HDOD) protein
MWLLCKIKAKKRRSTSFFRHLPRMASLLKDDSDTGTRSKVIGSWFSTEQALSSRVIRLSNGAVMGATQIWSEVVDSAW